MISPQAAQDREKISRQILGKGGDFPAYFKFYDDLARRNNDYHLTVSTSPCPLPVTNIDVLRAAKVITSNLSKTKKETEGQLRKDITSSSDSPDSRYHGNEPAAIGMAVEAMFMIDPAAKERHASDFRLGQHYRPSSWLPDETLASFVERIFPPSLVGSQEAVAAAAAAMEQGQHGALRARKLQKRLGARFRPTNNLAEHLLFDEQRNYLYIFHHVGFLKTQLARYEGGAVEALENIGLRESLEAGTLPPQLLVETLYSLQGVLFPSVDPASAQILDELIDKWRFDPECAEYDGMPQRSSNFRFIYWGERMAHLHQLMTRRPPRNKLERWFHSHSTEGNALLIALVALAISIVIGVVSIGLNIVQIWLTWMAWKYPSASSGGS
ncbi:hypothetical protein B0H66DRAFT_558427 [Apodospora peruviana]|uniref:Uncharacterized protein n=1 Tax=Apodospora peruviana TaxID=516989 RepID=A0AAE0M5R9_9PEZI|nr:hypothetical protein B0H66DRAFT_558427 [Apodospora peruviana]